MRRFLAMLLAFMLITSPQVAMASATFTDLDNHWARRDILRLANQQIVDGYKGLFSPEEPITRAQFAKLVVTALGLTKQALAVGDSASPFRDVSPKHWGNGYITVAYENGIIGGYQDNTFKPDDQIRRVEIAAILVRALKEADFTREEATAELAFTDAGLIPEWALGPLKQAVSRNLIGGYQDGSFRPFRNASRGEATVLISRLLRQLGGRFDFVGSVTEVDSYNQRLTLNIQGQTQRFDLAPEALYFRESGAIELHDIFTNSIAGLILDSQGRIVFLELDPKLNLGNNLIVLGSQNVTPNAVTEVGSSAGLLTDPAEESTGKKTLAAPEQSLALTRKEIKAPGLGATGRGQIIAVIDTGVDPAHPDLRATLHGETKIVDWMDFSGEGLIDGLKSARPNHGKLEIDGKSYSLPEKISVSGEIKYGIWDEAKITTESGKGYDFNFNGVKSDKFLVVVGDSTVSGKYDTVLVDTKLSGDLTKETPLQKYLLKRGVGRFFGENNDQVFGFVVADIDPEGRSVTLGFDAHGHGTHVAGIAAASGRVTGMAPGSQVMVLKAMNSSGSSSWQTIAQAINYAAVRGAKIINLSLGLPPAEGDGSGAPNRLLENLRDQYGIHFVVAAGNSGPGLSTVATPADTDGIISVGAYISPEMWLGDYGWKVPKESLWFFSSLGPRFDGAMTPLVIAPGSAMSTVSGGGYNLAEGTSMAAPHVAGGIALLLDKAKQEKVKVTPDKLRQAVGLAAKPITGYSEAEQGYGRFSVAGTWEELKTLEEQPLIKSQVYHHWMTTGAGLYAREFTPGQLEFTLQNLSNQHLLMKLSSSQHWLLPQQPLVTLPKLRSREISVKYIPPTDPGLYVGRITGEVLGQKGRALEILNTFIKPYTFDKHRTQINIKDEALPGQYKRYFFQVPPGMEALELELTMAEFGGKFQGRTRLHLYNPKGKEVDQNLFDFAGVDPEQAKAKVNKRVEKPSAGTWELVAYTSATLSDFGLEQSMYTIKADLRGEITTPTGQVSDRIIVGLNPGFTPGGVLEYVTLVVRNREGLSPYEGIILVNGRAFSVVKGKVTLRVPPDWNSFPWFIDTLSN